MKLTVSLSEPFDLGKIDENKTTLTFAAVAEEEAQILETLGILGLEDVAGEIDIKPWRKTGFLVQGRLTATATQACVVTLDPVDEKVVALLERTYLPAAEIEAEEEADADFVFEAEDPPEPLDGSTLDLLAVVTEELALALEPYPRKEGAEIDARFGDPGDEDEAENPFSVLKQLKD